MIFNDVEIKAHMAHGNIERCIDSMIRIVDSTTIEQPPVIIQQAKIGILKRKLSVPDKEMFLEVGRKKFLLNTLNACVSLYNERGHNKYSLAEYRSFLFHAAQLRLVDMHEELQRTLVQKVA